MKKKTIGKEYIFTALILFVVLAVTMVLDSQLPGYHIVIKVIKKASVYSLVAVSMNLLNGFTGLFSLGQAGFMLLGAYSYAVLCIPVAKRAGVYQYFDGGIVKFSLPEIFASFLGDKVGSAVGMILALLVGGLIAAFFAYLIGLPVLRLKSDYLAIATLGFAEIMRTIIQWNAIGPLTNASNLLKGYPDFSSATAYLLLIGVFIACVVLLVNSTYGRAFKAIRDDEVAAEAMGINLAHHKRLAFVISSFFAGVGGGMLAMYMGAVQAMSFRSSMTYEILLLVVIGGIKRLGSVAEKIVPAMSVFYIIGSLIVIFANISNLGMVFKSIFQAAFTPEAAFGGVTGFVLMNAIKRGVGRGVFSNEAGLGSAPIAHAASSETDPVKQGIYGVFEVFADTIVICTMTSLVVLSSNVVPWGNADLAGADTTILAFGTVFGPKVSSIFIAVAILFFAFSTILSWSLYGQRCFGYLTGNKGVIVYQIAFIASVVIGATLKLSLVWNIADTMNGFMAVPNLIALLALSGVVVKLTRDHFKKETLSR